MEKTMQSTSAQVANIPITRLNHAVLYVRELDRSVEFYRKTFGFEEVARAGGRMAFLRAAGSANHHDLGLMAVGRGASPQAQGSVGLYHLAWEVPTIEALVRDPDGIEFEVMWLVPRDQWGQYEQQAVVLPLDLDRELQRFGTRG
jgi:predicted enzyme related to lactoylglutathione lyase